MVKGEAGKGDCVGDAWRIFAVGNFGFLLPRSNVTSNVGFARTHSLDLLPKCLIAQSGNTDARTSVSYFTEDWTGFNKVMGKASQPTDSKNRAF